MRINFGRDDRGMTEHRLNDSNIGAAFQHVSGCRMPERMRLSCFTPNLAPNWLITPMLA